MAVREFTNIQEVSSVIKRELDTPNVENPEKIKKVTTLYASNASGKTRLSKILSDDFEEEVLCYNAFIEDLFSWDNETYSLKIDSDAWIFKLVQDQGLDRQIIDNYKRLTGSSLEPAFNIENGEISFSLVSGDEQAPDNIKVSRGEESVLIWSIFFTVLENAIDALNDLEDDRTTDVFNQIQYVVIDDPVSSMDDTRLISVAIDIATLIHRSKGQLKFLITTHHPLFFNVLYNAGRSRKNWDRKCYVLSKSTPNLILKEHGHDSPFAYHHTVISEIANALESNTVKKYHFNLFRSLLEKTANFLGYYEWQLLLDGGDHGPVFKKVIDHFSHNSLSDLEYKELEQDKIEEFDRAFKFFLMTRPNYSVVAENTKSTVVGEYTPAPRKERSYQSEATLEADLIESLKGNGYEYLTITCNDDLVNNLRTQISNLNNIKFTDAEWEEIFTHYIANKKDSIEQKTFKIHEDNSYPLKDSKGVTRANIKIIDVDNIHNNNLQVINQYEAEGNRKTRYDVTILVNGLPLVHIELKRRGVDIREAFNQIKRYQRDSFEADNGLFQYVQLFVISNGTFTKYYSNSTREAAIKEQTGTGSKKKTSNSFEFTNWWADSKNKRIEDLVDFSKTFLSKHTLLNVLAKFCVFTSDKNLLVMRPYQIAATERILNRIIMSTNRKKFSDIESGGYIWHTTGSGKTLTSFKTAQLATKISEIDKVLFVVDRKDLDYQTMKEYDKFAKGSANSNVSTKILTEQLGDPNTKIIITTIQKLSRFIAKNKNHEVLKQHIVLIFDECHRSQFGDMHDDITSAFKKYHVFGFTGTPIFAKNASSGGKPNFKTTEQAFGEKLHAYTIVDAINDENVLPFKIDYINTLKMKDGIKDKKVRAIDVENAARAPERVKKVTDYIIEHFEQKTYRASGKTFSHRIIDNVEDVAKAKNRDIAESRVDKRVKGFNSIFAVSSIPVAQKYYTEFKNRNSNLKVALIYSFGVNDDDDGVGEEDFDTSGLDKTQRDFLESAIQDYNETFGTSYSTDADKFENYYKDLSMRVKNREIDLLIVVNMFLTGFDATTLNTLWVDKNLRYHGLLQAFSRTNRILNSIKKFGNIICFRDLEGSTNEALELFGNKEAGGIVILKPFKDYYEGYEHNGEHKIGYKELIDELLEKFALPLDIIGEKLEKDFIRLWGSILRMRNLLCAFDEFEGQQILSESQFQDYQSYYLRLYDKHRKVDDVEKENINDDLVFEIELVKQITVNIDYILQLVAKFNKTQDKEIHSTIMRSMESSMELRSKKELIERFISNLNTKDDVDKAWAAFTEKSRVDELEKIIDEENLVADETRKFIANAFRDGELKSTGTAINKILPTISRFSKNNNYVEKKASVIEKLKIFFEKYFGI